MSQRSLPAAEEGFHSLHINMYLLFFLLQNLSHNTIVTMQAVSVIFFCSGRETDCQDFQTLFLSCVTECKISHYSLLVGSCLCSMLSLQIIIEDICWRDQKSTGYLEFLNSSCYIMLAQIQLWV